MRAFFSGCFLASSVVWFFAHAEFLALILVLVYVGAVMTLFLFVVMMLNIEVESKKTHFLRYLPLGLIIVAFLTSLLILSIPKGEFNTEVEIGVAVQQALAKTFLPFSGVQVTKHYQIPNH